MRPHLWYETKDRDCRRFDATPISIDRLPFGLMRLLNSEHKQAPGETKEHSVSTHSIVRRLTRIALQ